MRVSVCVFWCGGQRTTCRSPTVLSTMWLHGEANSDHKTWCKHFCPLNYPESPINKFFKKKERKESALTSIIFEILLDLSLLLPLNKNEEQAAEVHSSVQDHQRRMKATAQ